MMITEPVLEGEDDVSRASVTITRQKSSKGPICPRSMLSSINQAPIANDDSAHCRWIGSVTSRTQHLEESYAVHVLRRRLQVAGDDILVLAACRGWAVGVKPAGGPGWAVEQRRPAAGGRDSCSQGLTFPFGSGLDDL